GHKPTQATGELLQRQHAKEEPTFYSGDPAPALARADVTCVLGPASSASAASTVEEGPLAPTAAVTSLWPIVGLLQGPLRRRSAHVDRRGGKRQRSQAGRETGRERRGSSLPDEQKAGGGARSQDPGITT
uniref:Uncharacterized protein n=1 Tax=Mustela putorius furo TaxID=9669 RepID=M3YT70_MUSPF